MKRDEDAQILAAARAAFIGDAPPLLSQLEEALLVLDEPSLGPARLLSALDATRVLEGTAELCHCEAIAGLAREMNRLLQLMRHGRLEATEELTKVLLAGRDQIAAELADLGGGHASLLTRSRTEQLQLVLCGLAGPSDTGEWPDHLPAFGAETLPGAPVAVPSTDGAWHVSVRFVPDALRQGIDPLVLLHHLQTVGEIWRIETLVDDIPLIQTLDAEACHLGLELRLGTDAPPQAIESALAPLRAGANVELLAPTARPADYDALLRRRCGDDEDARSRLLWIWLALGVNIRLRDETPPAASPAAAPHGHGASEGPPDPAPAPVAVSTPQIERRTESLRDRRLQRPDRRLDAPGKLVGVRAERLETLVELLAELATAAAGAQAMSRLDASAALQLTVQQVADLAHGACDAAHALRRVPVARSLDALQDVVAEAAASWGKTASLVIHGSDTDIDATIADVLADSLVHVLCNSIEHGLERPEARIAAGKPERGQLTLRVRESAGSVVVECTDDGHGLDREDLLARAGRAGLVAPGAELDHAEVCQLAFAARLPRGGIAGGRRPHGAGLAAIRRNIESLRGRVELTSLRGRGTTVCLHLPLSTSMIDGVLVLVGDSYYVIPLAAVDEVCEAPPDALPASGELRATIPFRGGDLPALDLVRFCGGQSRGDPRRRSLVVVRDGRERAGLVVDRVLGRQHALMKPLAGSLGQLKTLAGSAVLGAGDVGLVLDIAGIVAAATAMPGPRQPG